ncbi:MAG TPA: cyclodeaminase/cyclohydrolase family protein [Candidatus Saccharimonadales bacterium]|nr:cyclodeaminase/cyclohydrolase family protein [Candidatus Saccharimonadales bacterium]
MNDDTLKDFLGNLGDRTPTPGGGAVAALNGALAAATLKMVCAYSKDETLKDFANTLSSKINIYLNLADADARAFKQVGKAYKTRDSKQIDEALTAAMRPSIEMVDNCEALVHFCEQNHAKFNKKLSADLTVVFANLGAALRCSKAMIITNLKDMDNRPEDITSRINFCDELLRRTGNLLEEQGE